MIPIHAPFLEEWETLESAWVKRSNPNFSRYCRNRLLKRSSLRGSASGFTSANRSARSLVATSRSRVHSPIRDPLFASISVLKALRHRSKELFLTVDVIACKIIADWLRRNLLLKGVLGLRLLSLLLYVNLLVTLNLSSLTTSPPGWQRNFTNCLSKKISTPDWNYSQIRRKSYRISPHPTQRTFSLGQAILFKNKKTFICHNKKPVPAWRDPRFWLSMTIYSMSLPFRL